MNVSRAIGVDVGPHFDELDDVKVCDAAAIFSLNVAKALKRDCNEKIDKYETAPKYIEHEERLREVTAASDRGLTSQDVIPIRRIPDAVKVYILLFGNICHDFVPAFAGHDG